MQSSTMHIIILVYKVHIIFFLIYQIMYLSLLILILSL